MRLPFGFEITRRTSPRRQKQVGLTSPGGWWPVWPVGPVREPYTGAWQLNATATNTENIIAYYAVFACVTLAGGDIGKMRPKLMSKTSAGIWEETESSAFSPVLRKPNAYQNRVKFLEWWVVSKLLWGNTYILKVRDNRGQVVEMHLLDPTRTRPMIAPDGSVFYEIGPDNLAGVEERRYAPAREIIHDRMVALYHPLVGVSPLYACATAALQGLNIQSNSTDFFSNGSNPGGVITAPGDISQETADRVKSYWDAEFSGQNAGKVAVLGQGLKYEPMTVSASDAQLIEQLNWTGEVVCSCYHVPPYMVGIGDMPNYNNIEALNQQYYSQCLQTLIESIEIALDEGLELPKQYGTELDLDDLLRMDTKTMMATAKDGVGSGIFAPNEARRKFSLPPVEGGESPYLQQQNYSLAALARRDAQEPAPATMAPQPPPSDQAQPATDPEEPQPPGEEKERKALAEYRDLVLASVLMKTAAGAVDA